MNNLLLMATSESGLTPPPSDYIGFYTMDTDSTDSSINGYDGVDTNMTYDGVAAVFNDTDSKIGITQSSAIQSLTLWIKKTTNAGISADLIFDTRVGGVTKYLDWDASDQWDLNGLNNVFVDGVEVFDLTPITDKGNWIHVYIALSSYSGNYTLGAYHAATGYALDGVMSNVRVYDRLLSVQERADIRAYELAEHT